jgi:hypothetical protein
MDPIAMIVSALVTGAVAATQTVAGQAVKESYAAFKALIQRKFSQQPDLVDAVAKVTGRPDSTARQAALSEELQLAHAEQDAELVRAAGQLLDLLAQPGQAGVRNQASNTGSGALAQGAGALAAGQGGVAIGGNVSGSPIVTGSYNVVGDRTGVVRESDVATAPANASRQPPAETAIKVLVLAASPLNMDALRLDEEQRAIDQAMQQGAFRQRFDLRQHWAVRIADLQELLLRHQPQIVHFSGHGSPTSAIILQDEQGQAAPVPSAALSRLFALLKDNLRVVVLNACSSASQAAAIAEHIACVVGMSDAIADHAAIQFASAFYRALAYGRTVETAFELGLAQLDLQSLADADKPQLLGNTDPASVRLV